MATTIAQACIASLDAVQCGGPPTERLMFGSSADCAARRCFLTG